MFGWGITTGYFEDLWRMKGLDIPVPSFGHLSDLFSILPVKMNIHSVQVTDTQASDIEVMADLVPDDAAQKRDKVLADGAYYSIKGVEQLHSRGIIPAIPPPSHAVIHGLDTTKWHDKIVQYIKDKGTVYAFHKKYGYGLRALVEAQISRIKRCIGDSCKTQKIESQKRRESS